MFWISIALVAWGQEAPTDGSGVYEHAVELIATRYLEPELVEPQEMLVAAAEGLSRKEDWLLVAEEGERLLLSDGLDAPFFDLSVKDWASLPSALYGLEEAVLTQHPEVDPEALRSRLLRSMTGPLDPFSKVLSGDSLDRFDMRFKGELVGIGTSIRRTDELLWVYRVLPSAPASLAGIQVGDVITHVDEASTTNMPIKEVSRRLRGDLGSTVTVDVLRSGEKMRFTMTRARVVLENITYDVLDEGVGYLRIDHVSQRTVGNLRKALQTLRAEGALEKGLVLDLRGNTGGSLRASAGTADQFLAEGLLFETRGVDGGPVRNLVRRMEAVDLGDEVMSSLVVLMDEKTASGAEIIAGALLENDRAVFVGRRSFGKGKVQKIYELGPDGRFKLTVAEYLLANERRIVEGALFPDITAGQIRIDDSVTLRGFDLSREQVDWTMLFPEVRASGKGLWVRQSEAPELPRLKDVDPYGVGEDAVVELARRTIATSPNTPSRDALLPVLFAQAAALREEMDPFVVESMAKLELDWTAPESTVDRSPSAELRVSATPTDEPGRYRLMVQVENGESVPLHRAVVQLSCETHGALDGVTVPLGLVGPERVAIGTAEIRVNPGTLPRFDEVTATLFSEDWLPLVSDPSGVVTRSLPRPDVLVESSLQMSGKNLTAQIEVTNLGEHPIEGLEGYFAYPQDLPITLVDRALRVPALGVGETTSFPLRLLTEDEELDSLPMRLLLDGDAYGRILQWDVDLRRDSSPRAYRAPLIDFADVTSGQALRSEDPRFVLKASVRDETSIESVTVWVNGRKTRWEDAPGAELELVVPVELEPGDNWVVVRAKDSDGLVQTQGVHVFGNFTDEVWAPMPVDAGDL